MRFRSFAVLLLLVVPGLCQEFRATVSGIVTDPSGAVIPAASIVAMNQATGFSYRAATNESGAYLLPYIQPGTYTLVAEANGFKRVERTGVIVQVGQRVELSFALELGQTAENVTVTAEVPLLDTGSADLGTVIDQSYLDRQPIVGRNVMNMISYAPGIVGGVGAYGTAAQKDFSINGSEQGSNEVLVDGQSVVLPRGGGMLANVPLTEAVQEFRVHTTMFDAALGRSSGGAVSIVTRGGTNELHGSFYNYWRPNGLRANTWTNNRNGLPLAATDFQLYGGTVGGPVRVPKLYNGRNRTFFFLSMEKDADIRSQTWQARVPTAAERQGDFSQTLSLRGAPLVIYDPATTVVSGTRATREPFAGNRIPAARMNAAGTAILNLFPQPTLQVPSQISAFNWASAANVDVYEKNIGVRVDHSLSARDKIMGRLGLMRRQAGPRGTPRGMSSSPPTGGSALDTSDRRFRSVLLNNDYALSSRTVVNVRASYLRYFTLTSTGGAGTLDGAEMKLPAIILGNQAIRGWSAISLGENQMNLGGSLGITATDSYATSASVIRLVGNHSVSWGGEWRVGRYNTASPGGSAAGSFAFNNTFTRQDPFAAASGQTSGTAMASLLLSLPSSGSLGYNSALSVLNHYGALFWKDDWKVTRRLTLNIGLRWEFETPWKERYDRISYDFDRSAIVPVSVPGLPLRGGLRFAGRNSMSRYEGLTDWNNFGPRFGFAFQLTPKTVVRGGYGIFYSTGSLESDYLGSVASFNAVTNYVSSLDGGATPFTSLADPFPNGLKTPVGSESGLAAELGNSISFHERGRVLPYIEQWQFNIQRELPWLLRMQAAYVGSLSLKQFESFNLNETPDVYRTRGPEENVRVPNPFYGIFPATSSLGASSTVAQRQFWVAYPQFTGVTVNGANTGRSIYHGMQVSLEKRFRHGVSFNWNYTWSKIFDNNTTSWVNDRHWYRTVAGRDRSHVARFVFNWDLPFGPGRWMGGWSVSGRWSYESGTPLSISDSNGRPIRLANPRILGSVHDRLGDRRDAVTGEVLNPYFNIKAFRSLASQYEIPPEPPVFAELRAPSAASLDAVLSKDVRIRERIRLGFRFEAYAATNTPIFSPPGTSMANKATFGVISAVGGSFAGRIIGVDGARTIQIATEVKF